jgi:hypothetical protein
MSNRSWSERSSIVLDRNADCELASGGPKLRLGGAEPGAERL